MGNIRIFATVRIFKNIANTLLAIILLIATTGVTLNKHYCMGRLKSIAVNSHAEQCFDNEEDQMPCCKDISEELKIEEVTTVDFDFDATPDLYQLAIVNYVLLEDITADFEFAKPHFKHYSPPLPDRDIPVFIQSFLI